MPTLIIEGLRAVMGGADLVCGSANPKPRAACPRLDLQLQKGPSKAPDVESWRNRQMSSAWWRS